jgi:glycosyl transferase family 25
MALGHFLLNALRYRKTVHAAPPSPGASSAASGAQVPIYVLNLERSPERRAFILGHLAEMGMTANVFPAVDGRALDIPELERKGVYRDAVAHEKFSRSLSPAEIGCALSHVGLYEKLVREGIEMALVLEDDAMLVSGFQESLGALISELPPDWDVVQLIFKCEDVEPHSQHLVRFAMRTAMPVAAAGYLISKAGAARLVDNAYPLRYPADSLIGRSPRWGAKVYGARPQLVTINNIFPSNIAVARSMKARIARKAKELVTRHLG